MERYIGKMLDNRYEILEVIGQGGMAVVYKARCHRLNRLVAIKVLKPELADDAEFRRRFHDESQAVAMLSHPNIVAVYDVSRGMDLEYIVMELIDGITLKQYMERRGQLSWRESLHFITQIMRGLSHAHSRGIIHRDIKPQNIMVLRDGSVKVADFGIACLADRAGQTIAGKEALGSVHYISPEQAKGERADERSDIYSAGVVLFEMLTGRLPFEGESPVSIAIQHFSAAPLNPRDIKPDIPEALELICMKAMAPVPANRYQSADEMLRDLEEFRKNPEVDLAYDMANLRGEAPIDEPTQPIDPREIHHFREEQRRERYAQDRDRYPQDRERHPQDRDRYLQDRGRYSKEPDRYEPEPRTSVWKKVAIVSAAVIASILLIMALFQVIMNGFNNISTPGYEVPDLLGMTVEQAEADPRVDGIFEINAVYEKPSDKYAKGQIMEQDPQGGTIKKTDMVINVTISSGESTKEMLNVVGQLRADAELLLKNLELNLDIRYTEVYDDTVEAGKVISTEPEEGTPLREGDQVMLTISKGKELKPVEVPYFIGSTQAQVEATLASLGLYGQFSPVESKEYPAGQIVYQSEEYGSTIMQGSTIYFTVSIGWPNNPDTNPDDGGNTGDGGNGGETPVDPGDGTDPSNPTDPGASVVSP